MATIQELMGQLNQSKVFNKIASSYNSIDVKTTFKMLIRCKMLMQARNAVFEALRDIQIHETLVEDIKAVVDAHLEKTMTDDARRQLEQLCSRLSELTVCIRDKLKELKERHKIYQMTTNSKS